MQGHALPACIAGAADALSQLLNASTCALHIGEKSREQEHGCSCVCGAPEGNDEGDGGGGGGGGEEERPEEQRG